MPRPRSDIEPRIVHAARRRFLTDGVDGATLRNIAKDAGTSIGMIYYYFPTKDDLFLAVVEEVYGKVLVELEEALAGEASFEARIGQVYQRIGALAHDELDVFRLVVREAMVSSDRLDHLLDRFKRGHIGMMLKAVAEGMGAGDLDTSLHPAVMVMATFALGIAPQMIRRIAVDRVQWLELPPSDEFAAELVRVLLHGIAKTPEASSNPEARK